MASDKSQVRAFRLRKSTLRALAMVASTDNRSVNKCAETALREWLKAWLRAKAAQSVADGRPAPTLPR